MKNVWNQRQKRRMTAIVLLAVCICCTGCAGAGGPVKFFVFGEIIANPPLYDASPTRKPLFKDSDGTVHGPQIGTTESGTPVYDYEIEDSLAQAPQGWLDFTYEGRKQSYLSPDGVWLFRDADGTIHGPQIGTTESGTPMFDYEFDAAQIPQEWQNW